MHIWERVKIESSSNDQVILLIIKSFQWIRSSFFMRQSKIPEKQTRSNNRPDQILTCLQIPKNPFLNHYVNVVRETCLFNSLQLHIFIRNTHDYPRTAELCKKAANNPLLAKFLGLS
jgi:hypothetical protein